MEEGVQSGSVWFCLNWCVCGVGGEGGGPGGEVRVGVGVYVGVEGGVRVGVCVCMCGGVWGCLCE